MTPMVLMCAPCIGSWNDWPDFSLRRDPVFRIDFGHHAAPVGGFAQHEFDELGARGERREPEAAARRRRKPRRIDRQIVEHGALAAVRRDDDDAVSPAFADQHSLAGGTGAERVVQARGERAHAPAGDVEDRGPCRSGPLHQVVHPLPPRPRGRTVGRDQRSCGPGDSALIALWRDRKRSRRPMRPTAWQRPEPRARRARPQGRRPAGNTAPSRAIETPDLGGCAGVEPQNSRAIRDVEDVAVGGEILGGIELARSFPRLSRIWLGFKAPSNDGTVMVASPRPRKRSTKSLNAAITAFPPAMVVLDEIWIGAGSL